MIAIEYHADLKEVQGDPRLAVLLGDAEQAAPFDRLSWWRGLAEHCGLSPLLAVARDGEAMAVLPLMAGTGRLEALANWYSFRWRPVVSAGADGGALLTALARDLAARTGRIALSGVPGEDGSLDQISRAFRSAGWLVFSEFCDTNHILRLKGRSYREFLAARPGALRSTLQRKGAKIENAVLTRFDPEAWAQYEAIYAASWKPAEGSPAFLRHFAEAEGAAGRLRLGIARVEGRAIAAQIWTVDGNAAFIHKLAHIEAAKALSPGSVLSAAMFKHAIDIDRAQLIDFGTGDDGYKRDWMEEVRPRYRLDIFRPAHPANWPRIARAALSRLARQAKHG